MSKGKNGSFNSNTLYAYFTKSPSVLASPAAAQTPGKENVSASPKESAGSSSDASATASTSGKKRREEPVKRKRTATSSRALDVSTQDESTSTCPFNEGDLVWAKVEFYPWWPSLVGKDTTRSSGSHHRTSSTNSKSKSSASTREVHVHFFGHPPSHAWIMEKNVRPFDDNVGPDVAPTAPNAKLRLALTAAEESRKLPADDRLSLFLCMALSADEDPDDPPMDRLDDVEDQDNPPVDIGALSDDDDDDDDDDDLVTPLKRKVVDVDEKTTNSQKRKRRRIIVLSEDEDSDDEFKPIGEDESESDSAIEHYSDASEDKNDSASKKKKQKTGKGKKQTRSKPITARAKPDMIKPTDQKKTILIPAIHSSSSQIEAKRSPTVSDQTKARLPVFTAPSDSVMDASASPSEKSDGRIFTHLKLDFLKKGQIRDSQKRLETNPEYDPKTLYVPESFKRIQTPGMRQWWDMKSNHFDVILFFKVGKFYELYHMDAVIGASELNLVLMKGDYAHAGFPEIAYGRYSASLVERGYRVARVEQTENPAMMEQRCKNISRPTKFDRVVKREICQITTKGTRRYGFLDLQASDSNPAYLLAVTEKSYESTAGGESEFGVCFVDTSIGKFRLGQFRDDRHGSRFRTLIAHISPVQILYEKGALLARTLQIINNCVCDAIVDPLSPKKEFWESDKTLQFLFESAYFNDGDDSKGQVVWPEVLKMMQDNGDCRGLTAKREYALAIRALGACTWYLRDCFLDDELLSMKCFELYVPVDVDSSSETSSPSLSVANFFRGKRNMILDGITLKNLDILQNNMTGTLEGTLLTKLDHCSTLAGKRILRQWICTPLCDSAAIEERLDAIDDLIDYSEIVTQSVVLLKQLPDLERLLSKIHAQGSVSRSENHPDSRAIFYDDKNFHGKRKILDFLATLRGFKIATEVVDVFSPLINKLKSKLLRRCIMVDGDGMFPDLTEPLAFFDAAFDHANAKKEGKILPSKGVDSDYDNAVARIKQLQRELDSYLEKQCRFFHCKVTYVGSGRNRFQLEVPDHAGKHVNIKYELQGQRKGFKRYWTTETKELLAEMISAEEKRDSALSDIMRRIFATFARDFKKWDQAVQCLAILDVLLSLALYSQCGGNTMCRPSVLSPSDDTHPFIMIRDGCHPCVSTVFSRGSFIPNDSLVGIAENDDEGGHSNNLANLVLVTGPNMGGKSTLMRQVGLIVIVAQLGCYVPASACQLTPVDRVFTRLGASDRIMLGESTFFVELSETACILRHATPHSLVLVDELGRGTSTYDGVAIAHAVVRELAQRIRCRTFFSTHYHSLVEQFSHDVNSFQMGHMACLVENENEDDPTEETITFLYKFVAGACPKSYGFNAAKLAGIPNDVVKVGHRKAREMEDLTEMIKVFRALNKTTTTSTNVELIELISAIRLN